VRLNRSKWLVLIRSSSGSPNMGSLSALIILAERNGFAPEYCCRLLSVGQSPLACRSRTARCSGSGLGRLSLDYQCLSFARSEWDPFCSAELKALSLKHLRPSCANKLVQNSLALENGALLYESGGSGSENDILASRSAPVL
jgi:hypothetical protein